MNVQAEVPARVAESNILKMRKLNPLSVSQSVNHSIGQSLAESQLQLRGFDAEVSANQFGCLADSKIAVHMPGDGENYLQALCFPVVRLGEADIIQTIASVSPIVLVELLSRHVICLRLLDLSDSRFSIGTFLRSINRCLERLPQGKASWATIEKSIKMVTRRRVVLENHELDANDPRFLSDTFPEAISRISASLFSGKRFISAATREQTASSLSDIQINNYRESFSAFISNLDGDAVEAIRVSGLSLSVARYNAYRSGDRGAHYRVQAASTIPLLSYLIDEESDQANLRLQRLIDSGQPLWPALSDTLGVPEETLRWLRGKTAADVGDAWLGRIPDLMRSLSQILPGKRPIRTDDWSAFTDFALALSVPEEYSYLNLAPYHAGWLKDISRLGWIPAREKFEAIGAVPSDLVDIADFLSEIVTVVKGEMLLDAPLHHLSVDPRWGELKKAIETLFLETSILKQLRASLRWHALQLMPPDEEVDAAKDTTQAEVDLRLERWPAPVADPIALGGIYAHFLTTRTQLVNEGHRMRHCVGSYAQRCLYDGANIVSLRDGNGRSVSTAELRLDARGETLRMSVVQHRAQNNSAPSVEAMRALSRLLAELNVDSMQPRLLQMRIELKKRQEMEGIRSQWQVDAPVTAHRLNCVKLALKEHVGYERFLEIGRRHLATNVASTLGYKICENAMDQQ